MRIIARVWVLLLLLAASLASCRPDPNLQFIQGGWYYLDPHLQSVTGESQSETVWTFDRGAYTVYSCCFVKIQSGGSYQLIESEGDILTIEMFNSDGVFYGDRASVRIEIDRAADTIEIQGAGPYTRSIP